MKKILNICIVLVVLCVFVVTFSGCTNNKEEENLSGEKLSIITTIFPQYDFARAIGGDKVDVKMLLSPGVESHGFEPTLQDISNIGKSDLFIYVGGESDEWVNNVLDTVKDKNVKTIALVDTVETVEEELVEGMEEHEHEEEEEHEEEPEIDEHVWTSPKNAIKIVNKICETLSEIDSENAEYYKNNADNYIKELEKIDSDLIEIVQNARIKTLVFAERFPFRYLAEHYGLKYYAAFPGCSSNSEPSLATINLLVEKVKEENVSKVFYIEFSNGAVADTICQMTGATKAELHSCHNVSKEDFNNGVTYIDLMKRNVETLREALK